jgi:hypothetical protein
MNNTSDFSNEIISRMRGVRNTGFSSYEFMCPYCQSSQNKGQGKACIFRGNRDGMHVFKCYKCNSGKGKVLSLRNFMKEVAPELIEAYDIAFPPRIKKKPSHIRVSYQDCIDKINERNAEKQCKEMKKRGTLNSFFN